MKKIIILGCFFFLFSCIEKTHTEKKMQIILQNNNAILKDHNYKVDLIKKNDMKTKVKNVEFKMNSNIKNCIYKIYVDDILISNGIANEKNYGAISIDASINQVLLKSGIHNFKMQMLPVPGEKNFGNYTYGDFKLWYWDVDKQEDDGVTVLSMRTPEDNSLKELPYFELKAEVNLELPFSIEGWANSVNLKEEMENGVDLKKEIQSDYDEIMQIIKNRDVQAFAKLIKEREELLGVAFYSSAQEKQDNLKEFLEIIRNPDYELQAYPQKAELRFFGYGKLVTLASIDRESVIELVNKKTEKNISLDFYFHRKKKGMPLEVIL